MVRLILCFQHFLAIIECTCWQTQDKVSVWSRVEVVYTFHNVSCCPLAYIGIVFQYYKTHLGEKIRTMHWHNFRQLHNMGLNYSWYVIFIYIYILALRPTTQPHKPLQPASSLQPQDTQDYTGVVLCKFVNKTLVNHFILVNRHV